MSSCCFAIIKEGKIKYTIAHYSCIKDLLQGKDEPENFRQLTTADFSDTFIIPAVIIDFDNKILINTSYNWFDNFQEYLIKGWTFKEKLVGGNY